MIYRVSQKKVYSSFLGKRWSKCSLKLTSFTQCNAQTLLYHLTKFYNYWTYTNHTNHKTTSPGAVLAWLKIDMFTLILVHNIGSACTKPSLTGLCSRVHNSDETQLTHLKFCTHVNKHLVNNVCKNNFITSYCFWMLPNMLEYTFFWDTRYDPHWARPSY